MGRKPIGAAAMSGSERTRRWLERKLAAAASTGAAAPVQDADKRQLDRDFEARVQHEVERRLPPRPPRPPPPRNSAGQSKLSKTAEARVQSELGARPTACAGLSQAAGGGPTTYTRRSTCCG